MSLLPGATLGRYEIRSLLGKGGMGEVYLVHDAADGRLKALKLLPIEFAADAERMRRFEQEARATSALRHPNIISVFEVGQVNALPFLTMEFVEGETLREHVRHARLSVKEALDVVAQVADALSAAHEFGVVHRDIKPDNVMLDEGGRVRVLDFGLVKLTEKMLRRSATPEASTVANMNTDHGAVVGTTSYMSPEQLRGQPVDERADIWSLGVLLHEVLTTEQPFRGGTTSELIVSILEREPSPLSQHWPEAPEDLQRIVDRALRKNPDERYQTAAAFLADVKSFLDGGHVASDLSARTAAPAPGRGPGRAGAQTAPDATPQATRDVLPLNTDPSGAPLPTLDEARAARGGVREPPEARRSARGVWPLLLTFTLALGAGYYGYERSRRAGEPGPLQTMRVNRLRLPGEVAEAVVSPDGRYVAAVVDRAGAQGVVVRELATSRDTQVVPHAGRPLKGLSFSPDGRDVYFLEDGDETGALWRAPARGGDPEKLLDNVNTSVTFSPDGRRIAFLRYDMKAQTAVLMTADPSGRDARIIAASRPPEVFMLGGGPSWSPDGETVACVTLSMAEPAHMGVEAVRVADGSGARMTSQAWAYVEDVAWLPDGSGIVVNANEHSSSPAQIWFLPRAGGDAQRVTNDPNSYRGLSLTAAGDVLITTRSEQFSDIWIWSEGGQTRKVTSSKYKGSNGISWTPGGRLVYSSSESEDEEIWTMDAGGGDYARLTGDPSNDVQPSVSGDGRRAAFVSYRAGASHIFVMDIDGGGVRQLTRGAYEDTPQISPDGAWVVYHAIYPGRDSVWKAPAAGGEPVLLTSLPSLQPAVSPDGKLIACFSREDRPDAPWRIAVIPFGGGAPVSWLDPVGEIDPTTQPLRWTADGRALTYVVNSGGVSNVWAQPLEGGAPRRVTDFAEARIFSFAWSADGRRLACVRGMSMKDVMEIRNFR